MLKMVDGTGIIGVDMVCPLGGTVSPPQPPNFDKIEMEGVGSLTLPNSLKAPLERVELIGNSVQPTTTGKNLANPSEFVIGALAVDTGNVINLKQYITTGYIPVIPGKRYSTSCGNKFSAHTIIAYDKEKAKINSQINMSSEMPENSAYIRRSYVKVDMTDITESDLESLKKVLMVNEGDSAKPYEPYTGGKPSPRPEYPQEIKSVGRLNEDTGKYEVDVKVTGKNLLNLQKEPDVKGTYLGWKLGDGRNITLSVKDKGNNADITGCYLGLSRTGSTGDIGVAWMVNNGTVSIKEITNTCQYVSVYPPYKTTVQKLLDRFDIQLEFANNATNYEPYKEQTLTLTSDRPITKWDKLVERGGQYGWLYGSKIYVVTGNEVFEPRSGYDQDAYTNRFIVINDLFVNRLNDKQLAYCKILKRVQYIYSQNKLEEGIDTNINQLYIKLSNDRIGVLSSDDTETRTAKIAEYIKNTYTDGIEILYATTDTVFLPLSESEQTQLRNLHSYNGTTHITVDSGEVTCGIKLTYRKEK